MPQLTPPITSRLAEFGMDLPDWLALMAAQDGKCAICLKTFTRKRPPCNDHNHLSGWMRGLLCANCNRTIGFMHDDAEWFHRAWAYLDSPPANEVFLQPRVHRDAPPQGTA